MKFAWFGPVRIMMTGICLMAMSQLCAQIPPEPGPTSATDSDVRIHNQKRIFKQEKKVKVPGQTRIREQQGEPLRKPRPTRNPHQVRSEAKVFKKHNGPKNDGNYRVSGRRVRKQTMTRKERQGRKKQNQVLNAGRV